MTTRRRTRWDREIGRSKEAKKKPKAKSAQPKLSPLSEPPQNVEVIEAAQA